MVSTQATADSNAYKQAVLEIDPTAQVWQVGCQDFVPLIEGDRIYDPYTLAVAKRYLNPLIEAGIDTLVYGCTHYPHLAPVFKQILPEHISLVDPAEHLTAAAQQELEILRLRRSQKAMTETWPGKMASNPKSSLKSTEFYVSGDPNKFAQVSQQWLGFKPQVAQVSVATLEMIHAGSSRLGDY